MKQLLPTNDRILIKPIDEGEQTYGSIVIPDMGKEKPEMGEVLAIGPGRQSELDPRKLINVRSCKVGDIVLVPKIGTLRIDFEGDLKLVHYVLTSKAMNITLHKIEKY